MSLPRPCKLFLFDLDGTLIDSREDIARAVNAMLKSMELPALSVIDVVRLVGDGMEALIQRVLRNVGDTEPDHEQVAVAMNLMIKEYGSHLIESTRLYPGVRETLEALRWARLGLVSNKPEALSRRILVEFRLADRFCAVLGGDSLPRRKPDPAPLIEAMSCCRALPSETVMVGDSPADVLAGKAAGIFTCGMAGGYRGRAELQEAGCDLIIDHFEALLTHFVP